MTTDTGSALPPGTKAGEQAVVEALQDIAGDRDQWMASTREAAATLAQGLIAAGSGRPAGRSAGVDIRTITETEQRRSEPAHETGLEVVRDILVFAPVAIAWLHLRQAVPEYSAYTDRVQALNHLIVESNAKVPAGQPLTPLLETKSFLTAWSSGLAGSSTLPEVALQIVAAIFAVAVLTAWIWRRRRSEQAAAQQRIDALADTMLSAQARILAHQARRSAHADDDPATDVTRQAEQVSESLAALLPTLADANKAISGAMKRMTTATEKMDQAMDRLDLDLTILKSAAESLERQAPVAEQLADLRTTITDAGTTSAEIAKAEERTIAALGTLAKELAGVRKLDAQREQTLVEAMRSIAIWLDEAERISTWFRGLAASLPEPDPDPAAVSANGDRPVAEAEERADAS